FDSVCEYERWAEGHLAVAGDAPTVHTPRGRHVYVRVPGCVPWQKLPAGELIADSLHYVVVPPSRHPNGSRYQWVPYPPLGRNDFPLLDLEDTGFVRQQSRGRDVVEERKKRWKGSREEEYGLCANTAPPLDPEDLPLSLYEAVLRTLPSRAGERNEKLFYL